MKIDYGKNKLLGKEKKQKNFVYIIQTCEFYIYNIITILNNGFQYFKNSKRQI